MAVRSAWGTCATNRGYESRNVDRSVLNAPHDCDSGVTAEPFGMPRCALFELVTLAQPQPLAIDLDAAHRLAFDVERPFRSGSWLVHGEQYTVPESRRMLRTCLTRGARSSDFREPTNAQFP